MKKTWEHSVVVSAPVDQVFALVADFNKHPEWDKFTRRVESSKPGDANGVGAEWKVYEQLGLFALGETTHNNSRHLTGLSKREVTTFVPNKNISWHTHPIPNVGVSADISYEFESVGGGTMVTMRSSVEVPKVVERVTRAILTNLDTRQQAQWTASLDQLKEMAEANAPALATA